MDVKQLSNGELSFKLSEYRSEYEMKKLQIVKLIFRLEELDKLYNEVEKELNNRKQSFVNYGENINKSRQSRID